MKSKLLGAVAAFAFVATGVAAQAQDAPRQENKGAPAMAPRPENGGAMQRHEGPKAEGQAQSGAMKRNDEPRAAEGEPSDAMKRQNAPKAAEGERQPGGAMQRKEAPKAAEGERRDQNAAAPRKDAPKDAQGERRDENGKAKERADAPRDDAPKAAQGEKREEMRQGQNGVEKRNMARGEPRVNGVKISNEHAVRIGETLRREGRVERPNFDVRVGVRVPEEFEIRPLPSDIVEIEPEYRGYDYFVDADDEIVFVSPETHEIVGTIAYEGRAASIDAPRAARPCPTED
jgi:hypothetical protein